jgi:hypothetical protein
MTYGHAERTLATIRLLEAETVQLLNSENHLDPEQEQWLREAAESASQRVRSSHAAPPACRVPAQQRRADTVESHHAFVRVNQNN